MFSGYGFRPVGLEGMYRYVVKEGLSVWGSDRRTVKY
jgi:hypothetical protein